MSKVMLRVGGFFFAAVYLWSACVDSVLAQARRPGPGQGPRVADNRPVQFPRGPKPSFLPLTTEAQQRLDQIMQFWEQRSNQVKTYSCKFYRWEYDSNFGPSNKPRTKSQGEIYYKAPDKGEFKVNSLTFHTVARDAQGKPIPGAKPVFVERPGEHGEHWICDGATIYEYDPRAKKLYERKLPPEFQGKAIVDGPLPFLFGAKADGLKQRYWLRELPPQNDGEYWLEAFPKTKKDSQNFSKVHVILAAQDFLPKGLVLYQPDDRWTTLQFLDRKVNPRDIGGSIRDLVGLGRYDAKTPRGWQRVVEDYRPNGAGQTGMAHPGQAQGTPRAPNLQR